jgi:hypothetical protein
LAKKNNLGLLCFLSFACATGPKTQVLSLQQRAALAELTAVKAAGKDCNEASCAHTIQKKLTALRKTGKLPSSSVSDWEVLVGRMEAVLKKSSASEHFEAALRLAPLGSPLQSEAYLGLALLQPVGSARGVGLLSKVKREDLGAADLWEYLCLFGKTYGSKQGFSGHPIARWEAMQAFAEASLLTGVKKPLLDALAQQINALGSDAFKEHLEVSAAMHKSPFSQTFLVFFIQAARNLDPVAYQEACHELADSFAAANLAHLCPSQVPVVEIKTPPVLLSQRKIGVLLPLRGHFADLGMDTLLAIESAFKVFDPALESPYAVELVIEDSGDDNGLAILALKKLVEHDHVAAVIGPLLSKNAERVIDQARLLQVPLLTLMRRPPGLPAEGVSKDQPSSGLSGSSGFWVKVFHCGALVSNEVNELVRLAKEKLDVTRVAIVSSTDKASLDTSFLFWDAAVSQHVQITGFQTYDPDENDFRSLVERISGLSYPASRQAELKQLELARRDAKIKKRNRKTAQFYQLNPLIDYDAVFFADGPKIAGQIIPTFSYKDVDRVDFLGLSSWNDEQAASWFEGYGSQCYFVDSAMSAPGVSGLVGADVLKLAAEQFNRDFQKQFDNVTFAAFDLSSWLMRLMPQGDKIDRVDFSARIQEYLTKAQKLSPMELSDQTSRVFQIHRELNLFSFKNKNLFSL